MIKFIAVFLCLVSAGPVETAPLDMENMDYYVNQLKEYGQFNPLSFYKSKRAFHVMNPFQMIQQSWDFNDSAKYK